MNITPLTHAAPEAATSSWQRRTLAAIIAALAIIGISVLVGSQLPDATNVDGRLSRWFVDHRTPTWNSISGFFSEMASTMVVVGIAAAVVLVEAVRRRWDAVRLLVTAMTGEVLIFLSITALVDRPRPDVAHLDSAPPTSSFPSGHTLATFVLWTAVAVVATVHVWPLVLRLFTRLLAVLMPAAVALSRVYRGMHHPTDVTASVVIGVIWMSVVVFLFTPRPERQLLHETANGKFPNKRWSNRNV